MEVNSTNNISAEVRQADLAKQQQASEQRKADQAEEQRQENTQRTPKNENGDIDLTA